MSRLHDPHAAIAGCKESHCLTQITLHSGAGSLDTLQFSWTITNPWRSTFVTAGAGLEFSSATGYRYSIVNKGDVNEKYEGDATADFDNSQTQTQYVVLAVPPFTGAGVYQVCNI